MVTNCPVRVLYLTYRYDPTNPDLGSSLDYELFNAIKDHHFEVKVLGPFQVEEVWPERILKRLLKSLFGKRYAKFPISKVWNVSRKLNKVVQHYKPDVIFTVFPSVMAFYNGATPYVCYVDTTFIGQDQQWPLYSKLGLAISIWQERRVFAKAHQIITCSEWSKSVFVNKYHVKQNQVHVLPMPAALPYYIIPDKAIIERKRLEKTINLLLVGRDYERKGIDIALNVVEQLNMQGYKTKLVIVGLEGSDTKLVHYAGAYQKSIPDQLEAYVGWYKWAHILIHPAKFEAAGIVPSEAAAFGVPTITNGAGGLATTVKHGESGIVLPKGSSADAYTKVIQDLVKQPERYYALCYSTRQRYDRELNWQVAGQRVAEILHATVREPSFA